MKSVKSPPRFFGGAVGFFSYNLVHVFEKLPSKAKKDINLPDINLILTDTVIAFGHLKNTITVIIIPAIRHLGFGYNTLTSGLLRDCKQDAEKKMEEIVNLINSPAIADQTASVKEEKIKPVSNLTKEGYMSIVKKCKEYIASGDIYQGNPFQRVSAKIGFVKPGEHNS